MSLVTAFKEIRLTNINTKVSGTRLQVGNELVVYQSDTGVFVTTEVADQRYVLATGAGYISGEKVFFTSPLVPTPVDPSGAVNLGLLNQASGYLKGIIDASSAGVSSLNGLSGALSLVGQGNITITTGAGQVFISGDMGGLTSLSGDLLSSGSSLLGKITSLSGDLAATGNSLNGRIINTGAGLLGQIVSLSGDVQSTGNSLNGRVINTGADLLARIASLSGDLLATGTKLTQLSGNVIQTGIELINRITSLSGDLAATGLAVVNLINVLSGNSQEFVTSIPTGVELFPVIFPVSFPSVPKVQATVEVTGDVMYFVGVKNRTTTGYFALFSDIITEDGVSVNTFAKI